MGTTRSGPGAGMATIRRAASAALVVAAWIAIVTLGQAVASGKSRWVGALFVSCAVVLAGALYVGATIVVGLVAEAVERRRRA